LCLSIASHTIVLLSAGTLLLGYSTNATPRWLGRWMWSTIVVLSTLYCWDVFGFAWLGLHLDDSVPLLYWSAKSDFNVMGSKRFMMICGSLCLFLAWVSPPLIARTRGGEAFWKERLVPARPLWIGMAVSLAVLTLEQSASTTTLSREI